MPDLFETIGPFDSPSEIMAEGAVVLRGLALPFEPALYVLATVVSANREDQVTVDAGTKALAVNGPAPARFIGLPAGASYSFSGDEHGATALPPGLPRPAVGAEFDPLRQHPGLHIPSRKQAQNSDGDRGAKPVAALDLHGRPFKLDFKRDECPPRKMMDVLCIRRP